jgi:hypothetical protein
MFDGLRRLRGRFAVSVPQSPGDEYTATPKPDPNESGANRLVDENDGVNQRVTNANDRVIENLLVRAGLPSPAPAGYAVSPGAMMQMSGRLR